MHSSCFTKAVRRAWYLAVSLLVCRSCCQPPVDDFIDTNDQRKDAVITNKNFESAQRDHNVVLVSTLDGGIVALDIENGGEILWKESTGPGPLLSSTISNMKISVNNHLKRLVPSLNGGLYKFDGESVEAFPVTAENLLSSSVKIADESIISGGHELRTYGINPKSGEVKYICKMSDCLQLKPKSANINENILIIKRKTQTVRGVDPMTGSERWNFSVGLNEASLMKSSCSTPREGEKKSREEMAVFAHEGDCPSYKAAGHSESKYDIKFVVPEGIVCAVDKNNPNNIIWKKKLSSPVVTAWQMSEGFINKFDLFDDRSIPALQTDDENKDGNRKPLMYMGLYNKQLYIQEAHSPMDQNRVTQFKDHHFNRNSNQLSLPWKPYSATAVIKTTVQNFQEQAEVLMEESGAKTALAVRYETCNSQKGYYLFGDESSMEDKGNENNSYGESIDQIVIMSLWHWWREVLAISIATSIFVNVLISKMKHKFYPRLPPIKEPSTVLSEHTSKEKEKQEVQVKSEPTGDLASTTPDFKSRYETDFEVVQCLGKGGFGKVFQARNVLDDCHYAVKRICLPNRENAREKVMREVKALAKLEHYGIVRYFNAWMECPPPGWQDKQDVLWGPESESFSQSSITSAKKNESSLLSDANVNRKNSDFTVNTGTTPFNVNRNRTEESSSFDITFERSKYPAQQTERATSVFDASNIKSNLLDDDSSYNDDINETPDWLRQNENSQTDSIIFKDSGYSKDDGMKEKNSREEWENQESNFNRPKSLPIEAVNKKIYLYIQMQLCKKGTLKDWMSDNSKTRDKLEVLDIFDQILCAVEYVHEQNLMHRDLKPSNIFFSMDGLVKIGDFGLVTAMTENQIDSSHTPLEQKKHHDQNHTNQVGTQLYMSPEQIDRKPYNHKVDIYSLGLILFELLVPFSTAMERVKTMSDIKKHQFPDDFKNSEECQLVKNILSHNPDHRPEASDIKRELKEMNGEFEAKVPQRHKRNNSRTVSTSSNDDIL